MAGYSARQSSFTTGDTILAAHSNDEFNQVLAAFHATTGHSHDGTAGEGGPISTLRDADSNNKILVDSSNNHLEFYVEVSSASVQQLRIQDGAIVPITTNDIDLGTSSLQFKDVFVDGTLEADAITLDGTALSSIFASLSGATFTGNIEIDVATGDPAIILDTQGADKFHFAVDDSDSDNLVIKSGGTVGSGSGLKLTSAGNLTVDGDATITGDLTVTGDDITMGTNTSGHVLVADGTNFNPVAISGDVTISSAGAITIANDAVETAMVNDNVVTGQTELTSIASDDVILVYDTDATTLKKITRSNFVSGLATSSALNNVVEDTSPQLGGSLDVNGQDIVSVSNGNITLTPNGTGVVRIDGSNGIDIQSGSISIKNSGSQSYVDFYCESSNAHYARLQAPAHSAFSGNITLTLPATTDTVAGIAATQTLTNKSIDSDSNTITNIVNADIKTTAAIAFSKMENLTASRALASDSNGDVSATSVTSTELGYLSGVSSAIQTQLDAKASNGFAVAMAIAL